MKNLYIAIVLSLASIATQATLALPPKPDKCPSLSALQNSSFNFVKKQYEGGWTVVDLQNNYDTADNWTFFLFSIAADNQQDAINNAAKSLQNLSFLKGPLPYVAKERWGCIYKIEKGDYAVAYTPIVDSSEI